MKKILKFLVIAFFCIFCFILLIGLHIGLTKEFEIDLGQSIDKSVDEFFDETLDIKKNKDTIK